MMIRLLNMAFGAVLGQLLKQRIRSGSIQAVKGYIQLVKAMRTLVIGLVVAGGAAGVLIGGILLTVVGLVGLLPVDPNTVAIIVASIGGVLTLVAGIGFYTFFNEKRWLEMSKAYDLMDAALAPWDGVLPPNPMDVVKGRAHVPVSPSAEEIRAAREKRIGSDVDLKIDEPETAQRAAPDFSRPVFAPGH